MHRKTWSSLKCQFGLFLDDKGLWRCGGRLQNADIPFAAKHPVLLPRKHTLTALIAHNAHQRVGHNGVKETLTELRQRYWVVRGRSLIRAILDRCTTTSTSARIQSQGRPSFHLYRRRFCRSPVCSKRIFSGSRKVRICLFTCLVT